MNESGKQGCEADIYCPRPGAFKCRCGKHVCYRHYSEIDGIGMCPQCSITPIDSARKRKDAEAQREINQRIMDRAKHLVKPPKGEEDNKGK